MVEISFRIDTLWNWFSLYKFRVQDKISHCYDDQLQTIRLCPNTHQRINHPLGFSFLLTTDQFGNRITKSSSKENFSFNNNLIWAVGDSLTMGWGVDNTDSFPFLLSNHGWDVVNLASDSIGSKDVLKILNWRLTSPINSSLDPLQKPKAIVWMFSRSDFQDDSSYKQPKLVFQMGKHSRILIMFRAILEKIRLMRGSNDYNYIAKGEDFIPPKDNHPTWLAINDIKKLIEKEKMEFIIVLAPDWKFKDSPPNYDSEYFKYIKSKFNDLGFRIIDMTAEYKKDSNQNFYITHDGHPSSYAYQKIAWILNLELKIDKRL